jgi:hypothetical protein
MPPTPDEQIEFLVKLQRLLDEGLFVASYKFALLLALADLSIEAGDDSGLPLPITTEQIAAKDAGVWRQHGYGRHTPRRRTRSLGWDR